MTDPDGKKERPVILVTNDDGIQAPGISALARTLQSLGKVFVVAPEGEMSATGSAITLNRPLRVTPHSRQDGWTGYAVNGTPADCVKIACWKLLDRKPDLVVSGINQGANTGINILYSGTVAGAIEGAILGLPSMAVSLASHAYRDFSAAACFARDMAVRLLRETLPSGVFLNINVPPLPREEIRGVSVTRQGQALYREQYLQRSDPHGRHYYWLHGEKEDPETAPDVDDGAVSAGYISLTPVHFDLTHHPFLAALKQWEIDP